MIIAMRAILITLLIHGHIFPECFLAFLANERHFRRFRQGMCLRFGMAFSAVVPLLATWCADRDLRVQDVFTGSGDQRPPDCRPDDSTHHMCFLPYPGLKDAGADETDVTSRKVKECEAVYRRLRVNLDC